MITLDKGYLSVPADNATQNLATPRPKNKFSPQEHLLSVIRDNDPSGLMADGLKKKLQENTQLINQLSARKSSQMTKEEARQKIAQIKEQIRLLRMMVATSVNPQATLRQIKQLSRELAEAARAYGMSAGTDSPAATETASGETSAAEKEEALQAGLSEGELTPSGQEENVPQESYSPSSPAYNSDNNKNSLQEMVAKNRETVARTEGRIREAIETSEEIRRLAEQLKNLYRQAVNQARQKKQPLNSTEETSIRENLSAAEKDAVSIVVKASFPTAVINTFI